MPPDPSRNAPAILCVVSDPALRLSIREALAPTGSDLVELGEAREAVSACQSARPELVLVDCAIDSVPELATELAGGDARSRIPWIAIGSASQCQDALRMGAADWSVPPVAGPLLAHRVAAVLRSARVERDLASTRFRLLADEASSEATISAPQPRERFLQRADEILRNPRTKKSSAALIAISAEIADSPADANLVSACMTALSKRLREIVRTIRCAFPLSVRALRTALTRLESVDSETTLSFQIES
jgi:PleD family two-component response regulator